MAGEPDVRLDGVDHETIWRWVQEGEADKTTAMFERGMQLIVQALQQSGDLINQAVQKANGGTWKGTTAESASTAMASLRDYDDLLHTHGTHNRDAAMGQSGEAAATRNRIPPPVPKPIDPTTTPTISGVTVDSQPQEQARRDGEQHAREVMAEYHAATRQRVAALPQIQPVPKVVLDTGDDSPAGGTGGGSTTHHSGGAAPTASGGSGYGGVTTSGSGPAPSTSTHMPAQPGTPAVAPVQSTGANSADPISYGPTGVGNGYGQPGVPGGSTAYPGGAPIPTGGGSWSGEPEGGASSGMGSGRGGYGSSSPGSGGIGGRGASGGGAQAGARSAAGTLGEAEAFGRRGGPLGAGRGGAAGMGGMMGGGGGKGGENDDTEHTSRYAITSADHFDDDDEFLRDPRNRDFYIAPEVIGEPE